MAAMNSEDLLAAEGMLDSALHSAFQSASAKSDLATANFWWEMAKVMLIQLNNTGGLRGNTVLQRWRLTNLLIATLNAPSGLLQYVVEEFDEAIPEELFDSDDALARRFDLRVHAVLEVYKYGKVDNCPKFDKLDEFFADERFNDCDFEKEIFEEDKYTVIAFTMKCLERLRSNRKSVAAQQYLQMHARDTFQERMSAFIQMLYKRLPPPQLQDALMSQNTSKSSARARKSGGGTSLNLANPIMREKDVLKMAQSLGILGEFCEAAQISLEESADVSLELKPQSQPNPSQIVPRVHVRAPPSPKQAATPPRKSKKAAAPVLPSSDSLDQELAEMAAEAVEAAPSAKRLHTSTQSRVKRRKQTKRKQAAEIEEDDEEDETSARIAQRQRAEAAVRDLNAATARLKSRGADPIDDFVKPIVMSTPKAAKQPRVRQTQQEQEEGVQVPWDDSGATQSSATSTPISRAGSGRKRTRWTRQEMDLLVKAIREYGVGNWTLMIHNFDFGNRTSIDLKDKYRNMLRSNQLDFVE